MKECSSQPPNPTLEREEAQRGPNQERYLVIERPLKREPESQDSYGNSHVLMNYAIQYPARRRLAASRLAGDVGTNCDQDQRADRN